MTEITQSNPIKRSELPGLLNPLGGGFYTDQIMIDGVLHALIVAPKAEGEKTLGEWGEHGKDVDAKHYADGLANTNAMAESGSGIAIWARGLRIDGHDDWAIPARDQLELLYRHCKPTSNKNLSTFRDGENPSGVPFNYPYTAQSPAQCANALFRLGGAEAFDENWYWSSTQYSSDVAWGQYFDDGGQDGSRKLIKARVRAVRTIPISD